MAPPSGGPTPLDMTMRFDRITRVLGLVAVLCALAPHAASAQSLRGSRASVDRMYRQAQKHDLTFYRTPRGVTRAADAGTLVRMSGNDDYRVAGVRYPYVLPATRTFIQRLARQYRRACGERLVVTSGVRPSSFRLINSPDKTVHPTGMAVDIRKPTSRRCLSWLRETLLAVEGEGVIEAIEERRPPHFHVAVYPGPYRRYVARQGGGGSETRTASRTERSTRATPRRSGGQASTPSRTTYRVRQGDSLWAIARRHNTSVDRLKEANDLRSSQVKAGQVLVIPAR